MPFAACKRAGTARKPAGQRIAKRQHSIGGHQEVSVAIHQHNGTLEILRRKAYRHSDVAARGKHCRWTKFFKQLAGIPDSLEHLDAACNHPCNAASAHALEVKRMEFDPLTLYEPFFHAGGRANPNDLPASIGHYASDGQTRHHMSASPCSGDDERAAVGRSLLFVVSGHT